MGSAHLPRIYFNGYQFWNPNTVNNNDYGGKDAFAINTWDPPAAGFNWQYLKSQGVNDYEDIPGFLTRNIDYDPKTRKIPPAEWGYFGGQQCGFVTEKDPDVGPGFSVPGRKTLTTGYTDATGNYGADSSEPWINQPIQLGSGKLVDVNPSSFWSSQVFADSFTLGTTDGFTATPVARMHSRFISTAKRNYNSNNDLVIAAGFGAVFQTCFAKPAPRPKKGQIQFTGSGGALQQQFQNAFDNGAAGIMLRYSAYQTLYFQGSVFDGLDPGDRYPLLEKMGELYQQYAADPTGEKPISRAYSRVAGWIGVWMPGELVSVPGGRFLIPYDQTGKGPIEVTPSDLTPQQYQPPPESTPPNTDMPVSAPQALGPATVEVVTDASGNAERFTLDLCNTFPERDSTGAKASFGTVKLGLSVGGNSTRWVSENVPYDQAAYETTGGLVDLPGNGITAADLEGSFFLQVDSGQSRPQPTEALRETLVTAQTDTRGMYAEQPDPPFTDGNAPDPGPGDPSTGPTCTVNVRLRGKAPGANTVKLTRQVLDYQLNRYSPGKTPIAVNYRDASGNFRPFDGEIDVPADGNVEVQVVSRGTAIPNLIFQPFTVTDGEYKGAPFLPPQGIGSAYYTVIKCLRWDNLPAQVFDLWLDFEPSNDVVTAVVWDLVFRTYFFGFPVMDFIGCPAEFQNQAGSIKSVTDPAGFNSGGYMPVTRTWSAGLRHIMLSYESYLRSGKGKKSARTRPFKSPEAEGMVEEPSQSPTGQPLGHG